MAAAARQLGLIAGLGAAELDALTRAALVHDAATLLGRAAGSSTEQLDAWCGLGEDVADILWYAARRYDHHRHAPVSARLLSVAHAFDDFTSPREYQVPLHPDTARMAIAREAGRRFCPLAVNALMALRPEQLDEEGERGMEDVAPGGRAAVDPSRFEGRPWPVDYRFVTNS